MRVHSQRGFSLTEILIAVTIIGLITGGVAYGIRGAVDSARKRRAEQDVKALAASIDQFEADNGKYPSSLEDLIRDPGDLPNFDPNGYIRGKKEVPKDPWTNEYVYTTESPPEGFDYDIISYGKDRAEGGEGPGKDIKLSEVP